MEVAEGKGLSSVHLLVKEDLTRWGNISSFEKLETVMQNQWGYFYSP